MERLPAEQRPEHWKKSRALWVHIPDDEQLDPRVALTPEALTRYATQTKHVIEKLLSRKDFAVLKEQTLLQLRELLTSERIARIATHAPIQENDTESESEYTRLQRYLPNDRLSLIEAGPFSEKQARTAKAQDPFNVELLYPEAHKLLELFTQDTTTEQFITISSSHRVTGSLFEALSQAQLYTPQQAEQTAIFQVDRHSDLVNMSGPVSLTKASVMRYLLEERLVSAVGCVGVEDPHVEMISHSIGERVTSLSKRELFDHKTRPESKAYYIDKTEVLFAAWKDKNIKAIYPSIDLDGLRLDDLGLTAVDYSLQRLQQLAFVCIGGDAHQQLEQGRYSLRVEQATSAWLEDLLRSFEPYQGVPTPWVIEALERARNVHGFEIGLTLTNGQRVAGDIVEFIGSDRRDHTAKLVSALTDRLLRLSTKASLAGTL